jgi:hypothetical protein
MSDLAGGAAEGVGEGANVAPDGWGLSPVVGDVTPALPAFWPAHPASNAQTMAMAFSRWLGRARLGSAVLTVRFTLHYSARRDMVPRAEAPVEPRGRAVVFATSQRETRRVIPQTR